MFSGIIDHCGVIEKIDPSEKGISLWIQSQFNDFVLGESIAIDGACLTVIDFHHQAFLCELSPETLKFTIAKNYKKGSRINLERSLRIGDRLGGHFVSGHIDQTAKVKRITTQGEFIEMALTGFSSMNYFIKKGSIAVNGVSLTVNDILGEDVSLMLIPHTLERTNLCDLTPDQAVNIEYDLMAKWIVKQLNQYVPIVSNFQENDAKIQ